MVARRLSIAAKERWRKRKADMEVTHNEVAEGPSHSSLTTDNVQSKDSQSAAFTSKRKVTKGNNMIVRRSNRLRSLGFFGKSRGKEPVQHIDLTDCDGDEELHVEPISLKPIRGVSSSEIEVDCPVHTRCKRPFASEATPTNLNYKILYTASVKKIEALTEENYQQAQKLHYMSGKVKIYENVIGKDVVAFSNGWRPTGAVTNLSDGTVKHHPEAPVQNSARAPKPPPVKRKYSVKRMKKN